MLYFSNIFGKLVKKFVSVVKKALSITKKPHIDIDKSTTPLLYQFLEDKIPMSPKWGTILHSCGYNQRPEALSVLISLPFPFGVLVDQESPIFTIVLLPETK